MDEFDIHRSFLISVLVLSAVLFASVKFNVSQQMSLLLVLCSSYKAMMLYNWLAVWASIIYLFFVGFMVVGLWNFDIHIKLNLKFLIYSGWWWDNYCGASSFRILKGSKTLYWGWGAPPQSNSQL